MLTQGAKLNLIKTAPLILQLRNCFCILLGEKLFLQLDSRQFNKPKKSKQIHVFLNDFLCKCLELFKPLYIQLLSIMVNRFILRVNSIVLPLVHFVIISGHNNLDH